MTFETAQVSADDDTRLAAYRWRAVGDTRAIVLTVHGMAEHARRYDGFAQALSARGFDVHAFDLRGHGATTTPIDHGYLGALVDWQTLLDDVSRIRTHALDVTAGRPMPVFLFGHSLGSFIVQGVLQKRGRNYMGAVLSGTDMPNRGLARLGACLAALEISRVEATGTSALLQRMTVGRYARGIRRRQPAASGRFDWLSSDPSAVAAYQTDPACGFALRTQAWHCVLRGIARTGSPHARRSIPAGLPLLLVSGQDDPVGGFGRGPATLARAFESDGQRDVTLRLYAGARHELLHEHNTTRVTHDVITWLARHVIAEKREQQAGDSHKE